MKELKDSLYIGIITHCTVITGITLCGIIENRNYNYSNFSWISLGIFGSIGSIIGARYVKLK